jgi:hypothetical protein
LVLLDTKQLYHKTENIIWSSDQQNWFCSLGQILFDQSNINTDGWPKPRPEGSPKVPVDEWTVWRGLGVRLG